VPLLATHPIIDNNDKWGDNDRWAGNLGIFRFFLVRRGG